MDYDSYLEKNEQNAEWQRKGATLSDKTARQEFGLTQDEIYDAIEAGTLQYRRAYMHGNPWLRLLRREVEALAKSRHGDRYVREQQDKAELARVNREIRRLRSELSELEERRSALSSRLEHPGLDEHGQGGQVQPG
jgi:predicted RNase H-like nuclease (RuvC/YqgF family)